MKDSDKPPSFWHELWGITRVMLAVIAAGLTLVTAVMFLADAEHHPIRAVVVLYSIVLVVMIGGTAWWSYKSKRRDWERREKFIGDMEAARRGEQQQ